MKLLKTKLVKEQASAFNTAFWSLLWYCYRKEFRPLLQNDFEEIQVFLSTMQTPAIRTLKVGVSSDVGWGCCIRVAQMLLSHTILRHQLVDYNMKSLLRNMQDYVKVLTLMNDNADGAIGAFSIQNVARMSLIFNKFPGEFHGPGSISNVMRDLNKMYLPYTNF